MENWAIKELCERALRDPSGLVIPCLNRRSATTLRKKFYTERKNFSGSFALEADSLMFSVDGPNLVIRNKNAALLTAHTLERRNARSE